MKGYGGDAAGCNRTQHPRAAGRRLGAAQKVRIRVLQSGEVGPYRQAIAGLDIALWDLWARRLGMPLCRCLSEAAANRVPVYASGMHIAAAADTIQRARTEGFRVFKVKIGFDAARDLAMLKEVAGMLAPHERLLADANQAWDLGAALAFAAEAKGLALGWLEEPLPADAPPEHWRRLAAEAGMPLAAGENLAAEQFDAALDGGVFAVVQPDAAKWGGISRCFPLAKAILAAGKIYCPHYLGGGIGLAASAHLLAAAGGPGLLEVDANPNPLREAFGFGTIADGAMTLPAGPGLGIPDLPPSAMKLVTSHRHWPS